MAEALASAITSRMAPIRITSDASVFEASRLAPSGAGTQSPSR